jgi:hypothetical protein
LEIASYMMRIYVTLILLIFLFAGCGSDDHQPETVNGPHRLSTVSTYREDGNSFTLSEVTSYTYSVQGRLESSLRSLYNSSTLQLSPYARNSYTHDQQGRVILLEATIINTNVEESVLYRYRSDGTLASMHWDSDIDADVAVTFLPGDTLQAAYLSSNGHTFTYRAFMKDGNPQYEKTINSSNKITDESASVFDDHTNPYSLLGYVDFLFIHNSKNNPLSAATQIYEGSQELIPESYDYTYNEAGLPSTQMVTYRSSNPARKFHMKYVFEYDQ